MSIETSLLMEKIERSSSMQVDLSGMPMRLTNDVICRVAFERKYSGGEGGKKFRRSLWGYLRLPIWEIISHASMGACKWFCW